MNLEYKIYENGYDILENGRTWIVQKDEHSKPFDKSKSIEENAKIHIIDIENGEINAQIDNLKQQLQKSDYKVVKCAEANLLGKKKMPYDVKAITDEREKIREQITELEGQLKTYEGE
jgi:transcriptional regulator NrdR family protein